jgi:hypothetical protein
VTWFALLGQRAPRALLVVQCSALGGCTEAASDRGPSALARQVADSGENQALSFDGVNDYATTGTAEFPDGHAAYTLSTWFKLASLSGKQAFIALRKDFDSGLSFGVIDGVVSAWRVYGDRTLLAAPSAVTANAWHHAAYTFDGTTNQLYVDGVQVASSDNAPDKRTPTTCWLGTLDGTSELLHGLLDDVHLFQVVRTADELNRELTSAIASDDPALVLSLTFDEARGPIVYDHSALANDGQLGDGIEQRMPTRVVPAARSAKTAYPSE